MYRAAVTNAIFCSIEMQTKKKAVMEQIHNELALSNAQELINVGPSLSHLSPTECLRADPGFAKWLENQREMLLEMRH